MKKSIEKIIMLTFALALCACGFSPMYSDGLAQQTKFVYVAPISGTNGIDLRNSLRARFGGNNDEAAAKYTLSVDLKSPDNIYRGLQKTGDATWQEVRMTANYTLTEKSGGKVILTGAEVAAESYTFVRDLVAAQASQTNAVQNTIRLLSDKISTRVAAEIK
jgi:hypothetical protein